MDHLNLAMAEVMILSRELRTLVALPIAMNLNRWLILLVRRMKRPLPLRIIARALLTLVSCTIWRALSAITPLFFSRELT